MMSLVMLSDFEVLSTINRNYPKVVEDLKMMEKISEMLEKLRQRFIFGEISEATYLELKRELESKLSAGYDGAEVEEPDYGEVVVGLAPGRRIGDYEIVRLIGKGGFGMVFEAIYHGLDKPVKRAIKTIPTQVMCIPRALRDIKREARIPQELSHPHIVRTFSFEELRDCPIIVMEYIEGGDLKQYLDSQPNRQLSLPRMLELLEGVIDALEYAHKKKPPVVHRDLKPGNLLVDSKDGCLKITDFGLAREVVDTLSRLSHNAYAAGTPAYMPFEQYMGAEPAATMDVYSLGIIVYELLCGSPPFIQGDIIEQHAKMPPPRIRGLSDGVMRAIMTALAKKPEKRYPSVRDFYDDLRSSPKVRCSICGGFDASDHFVCTVCGRSNLCGSHRTSEGICEQCALQSAGKNVGGEAVVEERVNTSDESRLEAARRWFEQGLETDNPDLQIEYYTKALEFDPEYPVAFNNRGIAYRKRGQYAQAIADYTRAIELKPDYAVAFHNRGWVHDELGNYEAAIEDYTRAIKHKPGYSKAYNNRGLAYDNNGDTENALADFDQAIKLDANNAEAHYNRGLLFKRLGNKIEARKNLERARELGDPDAKEQLDKL